METLGWIIWGFGCALLLNRLLGLGKKKRRLRRVFFCICTATGLVLTCFTSFSKFHLLWILPLQVILVLLLFGLWTGSALTYHQLTRRRPKVKTLPAQSHPPFGELKWKDETWVGQISLPGWVGFQSRGGPYCSQDSESPSDGLVIVNVNLAESATELTPTEAQCQALKFQIENGGAVVQSVLSAVLIYYENLKKEWESDGFNMPSVSSVDEFRKMIGLGQVHILPYDADGLAYVGLEFGCDWDDEHGLGVVVHGSSVVCVDQAEMSF